MFSGTITSPWGNTTAVRLLVGRIFRIAGFKGIQHTLRDIDIQVRERLPAGMTTAFLLQVALTGSRWSIFGPDHILTLIAIATSGVILGATRYVARSTLPAHWAQPIWAATAILLLTNILMHQIWTLERGGGLFRAGPIVVMIGSSFLLFDLRWFRLLMAMGLSISGLAVYANGASVGSLIGLALGVGVVFVAWEIRTDAIADLLSRRVAELGEDEQKRSFAATTLESNTGAVPARNDQGSPGLLVYDLGQVVDCNDTLLALAGRNPEHVPDLDAQELFVKRDRRVVAAELAYPSERPVTVALQRLDGEEVAVRLTARSLDWHGRKLTLVSVSDIRSEHAWRMQAETDSLTGLANRRRFLASLNEAAARFAADPSRRFAVAYLDLDTFKQVNDDHGHAAGDEVLRTVANRLRGVVRGDDVAARIGGDEFAVLLQGAAWPEAMDRFTTRVRDAVEKPVRHGERALPCSVSIGVAPVLPDDAAPESILARADSAMYEDKQRRRVEAGRTSKPVGVETRLNPVFGTADKSSQ